MSTTAEESAPREGDDLSVGWSDGEDVAALQQEVEEGSSQEVEVAKRDHIIPQHVSTVEASAIGQQRPSAEGKDEEAAERLEYAARLQAGSPERPWSGQSLEQEDSAFGRDMQGSPQPTSWSRWRSASPREEERARRSPRPATSLGLTTQVGAPHIPDLPMLIALMWGFSLGNLRLASAQSSLEVALSFVYAAPSHPQEERGRPHFTPNHRSRSQGGGGGLRSPSRSSSPWLGRRASPSPSASSAPSSARSPSHSPSASPPTLRRLQSTKSAPPPPPPPYVTVVQRIEQVEAEAERRRQLAQRRVTCSGSTTVGAVRTSATVVTPSVHARRR
jgi:hypothetical protein